MSSLIAYKDKQPQLGNSVWIAPGAHLIGDVTIGKDSSVWFNCVLRGDVLPIVIGERSNIQDLTMIHTSDGVLPAIIGNDVTVGHRVILHGCEIGDRVIVGMGSIVMDQSKIGSDCLIGAGSLVTEKTVIPSGTLAMGSPCRVKRDLTDQEIQFLKLSALNYVMRAQDYQYPHAR